MGLAKWNKKDLIYMRDEGYKIVPCEDESEAIRLKEVLQLDKKCAQAGKVINQEGKEIFFVCTKNRVKRGA